MIRHRQKRADRTPGRVWASLAVALILWASPAAGEEGALGEYDVKAAYIYNFAKFVEWPEKAFPGGASPLVITVLGRNPFGAALEALQTKTIKERPIEVRSIDTPDDLGACHVLYVSASEKHRLSWVLAAAGRAGLLTVSDIPGFADSGGMIGFVTEGEKIRFEINLAAARKAEIQVSSQLLKLARYVVQ